MLEPLPAAQWNQVTAAHLLNRAGFGGSPDEIENLRRMGPEAAVASLVDYEKVDDPTPPPDWAHPDPDFINRRNAINNALDPEARREMQREQNRGEYTQMSDLRYWWIRRMALGSRPFQEKMTLFWHGHFATSFEKVRIPYYLWLQNETLRQHATGGFRPLLEAVAKDPAMLNYLDGASSNKKKPNENFAREVMELFTLGEGHYTEADVQQSARCYTGWGLTKDRMAFEYHPQNHDDDDKTVFGQTGKFSGDQMLNLICDQAQCVTFITSKIWRFFVQDEPPQPVIDALTAEFQKSGMDLKHLMRTIFRSREFYAPDVVRAQIKSPVQWLISLTHQLQAPLPTVPMTLVMLLQLGQELFQPPNVKGWDGGIAWISTTNLLQRFNYAGALVEGKRITLGELQGQMHGLMNSIEGDGLFRTSAPDVAGLFTPDQLSTPDNFLAALQSRFLNGTLGPLRLGALRDFLKTRSPIEEADVRKSIRLLMSTPEYQLT